MSAATTTIYVNGKFLAQAMTGVQRFAYGLVQALDSYLEGQALSCRVVVLLPPGGREITGLRFIQQRRVGFSGVSLTLWEQLCLPLFARDGVLLCLSGSAPLLAAKCIPTIHDAAVFIHPAAYSCLFVFWYRLLFFWRGLCAPFVLTVSHSSADDLRRFIHSKAFRIIYNSAEHITAVAPDLQVLNRFSLQRGQYILAVGSKNPTKNFSRLIQAYSMLEGRKSMPLVIVGRVNPAVFGHEAAGVENDGVIWAGGVEDEALRSLYENAAFFVFPSLYEGFGIPPLEAMSCGCPVAASRIAAISEVCQDAVFYFDPGNVQEMATVMSQLRDDATLRDSLLSQGKRHSEHFSWDKSAAQLVAALREFDIV